MTDYTVRVPAADRSTLQGAFTVGWPVPGSYMPSLSTTGPRKPLVRYDGDLICSTPGAVYSGLDIYGRVQIEAFSRFDNCVYRGNGIDAPSSIASVFSPNDDLHGSIFEDSLFDLTGRTSPWTHNIQGSNFTIRRSQLMQGHDGIGVTGTAGDVTVEASWIHDSAVYEWLPTTPNRPGFADRRTHNDGMQLHRGTNIRVVGNLFGGLRKNYAKSSGFVGLLTTTGDDFDNTCMMIQQEVDGTAANHLGDILVDRNWFWGGAASINIGYKFGNALTDLTVSNNRFKRRITPGGGYYLYVATGAKPNLLNNVYDDDGSPVTITTY